MERLNVAIIGAGGMGAMAVGVGSREGRLTIQGSGKVSSTHGRSFDPFTEAARHELVPNSPSLIIWTLIGSLFVIA